MNTATVQRRDPLTEVVHPTYLKLAGDLILRHKQDKEYWDTVPVPVMPGDRVANEELRQLAVFMPLVLPTLAYFTTHNGPLAFVLFVVVYPLMLLLHRNLMSAMDAERSRQYRRDAGRYMFTHYLCEKLGLKPQEVTYAMLMKMLGDLKAHVDAEYPKIQAAERAAREARERARGHVPREPYRGGRRGGDGRGFAPAAAAAGAAAFVAADHAHPATGEMVNVNPANGLPMVDGVIDVHGNAFGTTNVDDIISDAAADDLDFGHGDTTQVHVDYNVNAFGDQSFGHFDPNNNGF